MATSSDFLLCIGCIILMSFDSISALYEADTMEESIALLQQHLCRGDCYKKFATDDMSCLQAPECSMCWDECSASTSINKSILDTWTLDVTSMVRDNSLVSTNIAWETSLAPNDCLVTWEVSGGGLIGNLLTQSSNVELSLWPETKYRVQVTCKNKQTEEISRSLPLTLDTSKALVMVRVPTASTSTLSDDDTSSQMQDLASILRDSSSSSSSNNNDDNNDDDAHTIYQQIHFDQTFESAFAASTWNAYQNNKEFVLGSCAAITVFLTILLAFIVSRRKSRAIMDKKPLVDNEVSVNVDVERLTIHV